MSDNQNPRVRAGFFVQSLCLSGRGESDPSCKTPSLAYYHYTTARRFF